MNIANPSVQALANLNWLQIFIFGVYPYVALTIAIIGTWVRFDLSQYSWKTGSTQMLRSKNMRLASNLFHVGIIVVLLGHLFGMLTPHFLYDRFISAGHKQILAVVVGVSQGYFVGSVWSCSCGDALPTIVFPILHLSRTNWYSCCCLYNLT